MGKHNLITQYFGLFSFHYPDMISFQKIFFVTYCAALPQISEWCYLGYPITILLSTH